ncbi:MAG: geranylgeranylglyceryl/heptaprenylglyceryl phosphate synthase [Bacteroidota bacterium]
MKNLILSHLLANTGTGSKQLAVLIDPDSISDEAMLVNTCKMSNAAGADLILVGGSLITNGFFERCIRVIKENTDIPVVLFPGNIMQIDEHADAILFLSLISGRNPDMLIGKHVLAAPMLKKSKLEVIPTGYMLIDGGNITSVSYMSNTTPIPSDKSSIAACTALAGEMLGLRCIYMDAGSGAKQPIPEKLIREVKQQITVPLFVGGGMRTPEAVKAAARAGADIVVVGNAIEKDPSLIAKLVEAVKS